MKFVADDGKIFDNYDECEEYERYCKEGVTITNIWSNYVKAYDTTGKLLTIQSDNNDIKKSLDNIAYIIDIASYITIDPCNWSTIVNFIDEEYGYAIPTKSGIWRWDYELDEWIDVNDEIKIINKNLEPLGFKVTKV